MAIRAEILGASNGVTQVALYYVIPVPNRHDKAIDNGRAPAGSRVAGGDLADLKNGSLYEYVTSISTVGMSVAKVRTRIEALWTELESAALARYESQWRYQGDAWDGSEWS